MKKKIPKLYAVICMCIFACATPFGALFGYSLETASPLIGASVMSLSVGTFFYLGTVEIMFEEFSVTKSKYKKFAALIIGAS